MTERKRHIIMDDNKTIWSSDEYDAFEHGSSIMAAVDAGDPEGYREFIGENWDGDLVFVQELSRTR